MKATILTIGDELLIGQVLNTNQAYIAEHLNNVGVSIFRMETVGDVEKEISDSFQRNWNEVDILIATGGLGPTHDDITRDVVCKFFKTSLVVNDEALQNVRSIVEKRKTRITEMIEQQALVPKDAVVIQNVCGTAPGIMFERNGKYFFAMPGVPKEMKAMMENFIIPLLRTKVSGSVILHRTLKTIGVVEAHLAERLGNIPELFGNHKNTTLAFLPEIFAVRLRISVKDSTIEQAEKQISFVENNIREKIGKYIFGIDEETIEQIIGNLLEKNRATLSTAESCTGGRIANRLTNISGSSQYFERGVIAYSNASKIELLGVDEKLIKQNGAVSKEVAEAMAEGIRKIADTTFGISTTGIAGPMGGSIDKPVGLVWIGFSSQRETFAKQCYLGERRNDVKERATLAALELLRKKLLGLQ